MARHSAHSSAYTVFSLIDGQARLFVDPRSDARLIEGVCLFEDAFLFFDISHMGARLFEGTRQFLNSPFGCRSIRGCPSIPLFFSFFRTFTGQVVGRV